MQLKKPADAGGGDMKVMAMTRTLGDITDELRKKVLLPAKEEAEKIVDDARAEAEKIVREANREAEEMRKKAREDAEETRRKMDADMQAAVQNFLLLVEERLEKTVISPVVDEVVVPVLTDPNFLKDVLEKLIREFFSSEGRQGRIDIILPEKQKTALEGFFLKKFKEKAVQGVTVHFTDQVTFGFKIGTGEGGRYFNFEDGLAKAFVEFCSPRFRKYYFGLS